MGDDDSGTVGAKQLSRRERRHHFTNAVAFAVSGFAIIWMSHQASDPPWFVTSLLAGAYAAFTSRSIKWAVVMHRVIERIDEE